MSVVYAPTSFQSGKIEPYITYEELVASATGAAVDWAHLIAGGNTDAQRAAAVATIWRASAIADLYTLGRSGNTVGTLNATVNTENQRTYPTRRGQLIIHPAFLPIIGVSSFSYGGGPGNNQLLIPVTLDNVEFDEEQFIITQWGPSGIQFGSLSQVLGGTGNRYQVICKYTYICGYANSFLTEDASTDDTDVVITDPTGIQPNLPMMVWDGDKNEQCQVDASYDGTSSTIPLASPLVYDHAAGTNFSALPLAVKQACIHICCAIVKERGQSGIILQSSGGAGGAQQMREGAGNIQDYIDAFDLLDEFRPTMGKF